MESEGDRAYIRPHDHRPHDALGRLVPRNPFADGMVLARALPGIGGVFRGSVPDEYRASGGVRCVCGAETPIEGSTPVACSGGCGRHFWRVGGEIRVANFEEAGDGAGDGD